MFMYILRTLSGRRRKMKSATHIRKKLSLSPSTHFSLSLASSSPCIYIRKRHFNIDRGCHPSIERQYNKTYAIKLIVIKNNVQILPKVIQTMSYKRTFRLPFRFYDNDFPQRSVPSSRYLRCTVCCTLVLLFSLLCEVPYACFSFCL